MGCAVLWLDGESATGPPASMETWVTRLPTRGLAPALDGAEEIHVLGGAAFGGELLDGLLDGGEEGGVEEEVPVAEGRAGPLEGRDEEVLPEGADVGRTSLGVAEADAGVGFQGDAELHLLVGGHDVADADEADGRRLGKDSEGAFAGRGEAQEVLAGLLGHPRER